MIDIEKVDRIDFLNKKEKVILEKYLQELSKKKGTLFKLKESEVWINQSPYLMEYYNNDEKLCKGRVIGSVMREKEKQKFEKKFSWLKKNRTYLVCTPDGERVKYKYTGKGGIPYRTVAEINDAPLYRKKNCYIVEVQVPTAWFQLPNSMSFLSVSAYHDCKIKEFGSE